jgi:hypothetical protein
MEREHLFPPQNPVAEHQLLAIIKFVEKKTRQNTENEKRN